MWFYISVHYVIFVSNQNCLCHKNMWHLFTFPKTRCERKVLVLSPFRSRNCLKCLEKCMKRKKHKMLRSFCTRRRYGARGLCTRRRYSLTVSTRLYVYSKISEHRSDYSYYTIFALWSNLDRVQIWPKSIESFLRYGLLSKAVS